MPYLQKRAERTSSISLCSEINAVLGEGTPPAWFRREEVTDEEKEVLECHREELRQTLKEERAGREHEHAEEQAGNTHVLVEEVHTKMFGRQEAATKRGRRALREEVAHMSQDELQAFVVECQTEFGVTPQPAKRMRVDSPVDQKALILPSLASLEHRWAEEDASTTASTP